MKVTVFGGIFLLVFFFIVFTCFDQPADLSSFSPSREGPPEWWPLETVTLQVEWFVVFAVVYFVHCRLAYHRKVKSSK